MFLKHHKSLLHNCSGAALTEYSIATVALLIPIIFGAYLLFFYDPATGVDQDSAIYKRHEETIAPVLQMSPVDPEDYCDSGATNEVSEEFCY